jgi:hypothetical protein
MPKHKNRNVCSSEVVSQKIVWNSIENPAVFLALAGDYLCIPFGQLSVGKKKRFSSKVTV